MSKLLKQLGFAGLAIVAGASMPAFAAVANVGNSGLCELIGQMQGVFKILRTLAFVGAAFLIAQWAWGYIKAGDVKMDELKDKGTALLVGFTVFKFFGRVKYHGVRQFNNRLESIKKAAGLAAFLWV